MAIPRNRNGKVYDAAENEDTSATHINHDFPDFYQLEDDVLKIMNHETQDMKALFS